MYYITDLQDQNVVQLGGEEEEDTVDDTRREGERVSYKGANVEEWSSPDESGYDLVPDYIGKWLMLRVDFIYLIT